MYAKHVPLIAGAMRASPDVFARGVMFAVLSARTHFSGVPDQIADLAKQGREFRGLWGWKLDSFDYVTSHKESLWRDVCAVPLHDPAKAIWLLTHVPGLGVVKAAFIAQFLGFDIACLDTRNNERESRPYFRFSKRVKAETQMRRIKRYVDMTRGRAEELWDVWCEEIAGIYGSTPERISADHLVIIPKGFKSDPFQPYHEEIIPL